MAMNKKEIDAQYQEHAQFNLTKLIRRSYEAGSPLPKEYFEGLDFLEESEKILMLPVNAPYGKQYRCDVKESLAANMVGLLPLEYYKEHIHPTWIVSPKVTNYGVVQKALDEQKYDFLYEILSQCKEYLKENSDTKKTENNNFVNAYQNGLLNQVLNVDANLEQLKSLKAGQEAYDKYFKLFNAALSNFEEHYNSKYNILFDLETARNLNFDQKSWFMDYSKMKSFLGNINEQKKILENLADNPKAFSFFKDILSQYEEAEKTEKSEDLEDIKKNKQNVFEKAFYYGNKKIVSYLVENKHFSSKEVTKNFENTLGYWLKEQEGKLKYRSDNKIGDSSTYLKTLLEILQKNAPDHKIENYELFSNILPAINKNIFEGVMKKYPELKEEKLRDGLTLNQWSYAKQLFNNFMTEHNFKLLESKYDSNYLNFDLFYMDKATQYYKPTKEISLDEKIAVDEIIAIKFLPLLQTNLNSKENLILFHTYTLNNQMHENKNEVKKIKI